MKKLFFASLLCIASSIVFAQQNTMGAKMALLSDGKYHSDNEPISKRYENIMNQLDYKYVETKDRIADMTSVCKKELVNIGVEEPLINIMNDILLLNDRYTTNKKYADNIVLYITLRNVGNDHTKTIQGMQNLLNTGSMDQVFKAMGLR